MENFHLTQQFSDAHEHAQGLVNFGQNYFQTEKGLFQSTLRQIDLDGLHLFAETANRQIVQSGGVLSGAIALGWVTPANVAPGFRSGTNDQLHSGIRRGGDDWMFRMPGGMEVAGITMTAAEFDRLVEPLGLATARHGSHHLQFMRDSEAFSTLRSGIVDIRSHLDRLSCADVRAMLRRQLLDGIFCALGESESSRRHNLTRMTYNDIVKRSQDVVLDNPESPPTVLDLCTELRVCRRTLQKSFLQVTGQSPSFYLRCIRLAGVRRVLRATPAARMAIGEAASRWGFFHLGNFANDYRRLFGELPSQTLRPDADS